MLTADKVTELFCMADDFCKFFDAMMENGLILLVVMLYRILIPIIFIPRFAEIWGRTSLCGSARALYRALVRPEGSAFFSQYGEPAKLCQSKSATTSSARFISTSDADKPPQKCRKARARLLSSKLSEDLP